jgi:heme/copper-type cytochrome/quinol oxidase subunit 2
MNETKKIIISAVVVVVVIILLGVGIMIGNKNKPEDANQNQNPETTNTTNTQSQTRGPAPKNIDIPDLNTPVSSDVAKPTMVMPAAPGSSSDFRNFEISITSGGFKPNKIIVSSGDVLNIVATAVDGNYDFAQPDYGIFIPIKKGEKKTISFQATAAGTFKFFCSSCGGPEKGPTGELIVAN